MSINQLVEWQNGLDHGNVSKSTLQYATVTSHPLPPAPSSKLCPRNTWTWTAWLTDVQRCTSLRLKTPEQAGRMVSDRQVHQRIISFTPNEMIRRVSYGPAFNTICMFSLSSRSIQPLSMLIIIWGSRGVGANPRWHGWTLDRSPAYCRANMFSY